VSIKKCSWLSLIYKYHPRCACVLIVDLHLKGNLVIVVGSGNEGMKKVSSLLTQDCEILVISSNSNSQITKYVKQGKIKFKF